MWNQLWGQMRWNVAMAAPATGVWTALLLGCLLGIVAVVMLRSARKTGLIVMSLLLLVPLAAFASAPHIFVNGTIADAVEVNQNFAAMIPLVGKSSSSTSGSMAAGVFVFPASPSFTAPRDLTCVVTVQPYFVSGSTSSQVTWRTAIKVGSTQTQGPSAGPGPLSLVHMPVTGLSDNNYTGTYTEIFSVTAGSQVSFGAFVFPQTSGSYIVNVNAVYSCTVPP